MKLFGNCLPIWHPQTKWKMYKTVDTRMKNMRGHEMNHKHITCILQQSAQEHIPMKKYTKHEKTRLKFKLSKRQHNGWPPMIKTGFENNKKWNPKNERVIKIKESSTKMSTSLKTKDKKTEKSTKLIIFQRVPPLENSHFWSKSQKSLTRKVY